MKYLLILIAACLVSCGTPQASKPKSPKDFDFQYLNGKTVHHIESNSNREIIVVFTDGTSFVVKSYKYNLRIYR